jgi:putative copper export protein
VSGIVLARYSQLALIAVALIVLTGVVRALGEMNTPADLWQTSYGWTILVKIGLLGIAGIFAVRTRRVVTLLRGTATPNTATLALVRRNAWAEIAVMLIIVYISSRSENLPSDLVRMGYKKESKK